MAHLDEAVHDMLNSDSESHANRMSHLIRNMPIMVLEMCGERSKFPKS